MLKDIVYSHEHIWIDLSSVKKDPDAFLNCKETIIKELLHLKELGVSTLIEVTNIGMGRDIQQMEDIRKKTGLNIVYSTGFYQNIFYPDFIKTSSSEQLKQIMINEIEKGIDQTNIKAGVIGEIGSSKGIITDLEKKVFIAVALAAQQTHVPIVTHASLGTMGLEQVQIFKNYHLDLTHILISHLELSNDVDYISSILDTGVNASIDTIGKESYLPDSERVILIKKLLSRGYENQIVLSMDISRKSYLKENGGKGYSYLIEKFVPLLQDSGITDLQIKKMIVENSHRIFKL